MRALLSTSIVIESTFPGKNNDTKKHENKMRTVKKVCAKREIESKRTRKRKEWKISRFGGKRGNSWHTTQVNRFQRNWNLWHNVNGRDFHWKTRLSSYSDLELPIIRIAGKIMSLIRRMRAGIARHLDLGLFLLKSGNPNTQCNRRTWLRAKQFFIIVVIGLPKAHSSISSARSLLISVNESVEIYFQ